MSTFMNNFALFRPRWMACKMSRWIQNPTGPFPVSMVRYVVREYYRELLTVFFIFLFPSVFLCHQYSAAEDAPNHQSFCSPTPYHTLQEHWNHTETSELQRLWQNFLPYSRSSVYGMQCRFKQRMSVIQI